MTEAFDDIPAIPADDLLSGVANIAAFIGEEKRRTYYLLEKRYLPAGKLGSIWIGSKRTLRKHLARIAAGEAA